MTVRPPVAVRATATAAILMMQSTGVIAFTGSSTSIISLVRHQTKSVSLGMVDPWRDPDNNAVPIVLNGEKRMLPLGETTIQQQEEKSPQFGQSVSLSNRPVSANKPEDDITNDDDELVQRKNKNLVVAALAITLAIGNYVWQLLHPVTPVQLLVSMQQQSVPVSLIGTNNKPTVVDFWAPWCENCKVMAPTLQSLEQDYKDQVNFVMINGNEPKAWPYIEAFGVDAIPHLAMVSAQGDVETALIGIVPKHVLAADLDVLLQNAALVGGTQQDTATAGCDKNNRNGQLQLPNHGSAEESSMTTATATTTLLCVEPQPKALPYQMLDAFRGRPEARRVHFDQ